MLLCRSVNALKGRSAQTERAKNKQHCIDLIPLEPNHYQGFLNSEEPLSRMQLKSTLLSLATLLSTSLVGATPAYQRAGEVRHMHTHPNALSTPAYPHMYI